MGDQEPISSRRKLLRAKAVVVSVAETPGQDFGLRLTSKGAAGVTGSGFIVLAATLASVGTIQVASIALILGVDRVMCEAGLDQSDRQRCGRLWWSRNGRARSTRRM